MRTLQWPHRKLGAVGVEVAAVERERLHLAECRAHVIDELERWRFAQVVVEPERAEIIGIDSRNKPQLHAPTEHLIDDRDLLRQTQGMVERDDVTHGADA